jgi:hypothetical protein
VNLKAGEDFLRLSVSPLPLIMSPSPSPFSVNGSIEALQRILENYLMLFSRDDIAFMPDAAAMEINPAPIGRAGTSTAHKARPRRDVRDASNFAEVAICLGIHGNLPSTG